MWKMPINPPSYVSDSILYGSFTWSIMSADRLDTGPEMGFINFLYGWRFSTKVVQSFFLIPPPHHTVSAPDPNRDAGYSFSHVGWGNWPSSSENNATKWQHIMSDAAAYNKAQPNVASLHFPPPFFLLLIGTTEATPHICKHKLTVKTFLKWSCALRHNDLTNFR